MPLSFSPESFCTCCLWLALELIQILVQNCILCKSSGMGFWWQATMERFLVCLFRCGNVLLYHNYCEFICTQVLCGGQSRAILSVLILYFHIILYIHAYVHTYIVHVYIHTLSYIHACIHIRIYAYIYMYLHAYIYI